MARETAVKALGEVVLRVRDLDKMQEFCETVVGLERLHRIDTHVFSTFPTPRATSSNSSAMTPRWPRPDKRSARR